MKSSLEILRDKFKDTVSQGFMSKVEEKGESQVSLSEMDKNSKSRR